MSVLDFLRTKKGSPQTRIGEMEKKLAELRAEIENANAIVAQHAPTRAHMLLSDATEESIIASDKDADLARLRLERLELAEIALLEQIEAARDSDQRSRKAGDLERAAAAIGAKTSALDAAASAFAAAYRELLSAVPVDLIDIRIMKPRFTVDGAATPVDIARAIAAQALAAACPELFENHRPHTRTHGDASAKSLGVIDTDRAGRLSPILPASAANMRRFRTPQRLRTASSLNGCAPKQTRFAEAA